MAEWLFWISLLLVVYCYLGYPCLIWLLARFLARPVAKTYDTPRVSIVMSVYNEQDVLLQKIHNLLSLDYPEKNIEILIGSDGSTDKTKDIINNFRHPRVICFDYSQRRGKMAVINDLVARATHDIIIGTDARQMFAEDAIKNLVANFSDPIVGCVTGELVFGTRQEQTARGVNFYWRYEKFIRRQESDIHSMLGATGAIYAFRKRLFRPIPEDLILDDMFVPLCIIMQGYRAIFDPTAKAYDEVATHPKEEYCRKVRTIFGNYQIFKIFMSCFIPFKSPIAFQMFSHKLLRVVVPFFLLLIFFINILLLDQRIYILLFLIQIVFYGLALTAALAERYKCVILRPLSRIGYVPYVFCLLNFSAMMGFYRFVVAAQEVTWEKARDIND